MDGINQPHFVLCGLADQLVNYECPFEGFLFKVGCVVLKSDVPTQEFKDPSESVRLIARKGTPEQKKALFSVRCMINGIRHHHFIKRVDLQLLGENLSIVRDWFVTIIPESTKGLDVMMDKIMVLVREGIGESIQKLDCNRLPKEEKGPGFLIEFSDRLVTQLSYLKDNKTIRDGKCLHDWIKKRRLRIMDGKNAGTIATFKSWSSNVAWIILDTNGNKLGVNFDRYVEVYL
jgi:hypothetical protein